MSVLVQVGCTGLVCLLSLSLGVMTAWPSSTLMLFESTNTTLHRPMNDGELALLGSLSSIGSLISSPIAGYFLDTLGRKNTAFIASLTGTLSWLMILSSNRVEMVLTAIFVTGLSGAIFLVVPLYISEICQESLRGAMTSGSMVAYGLGMLLSYVIGGYLEYNTMIYVCFALSVLGTVSLLLLKESPTCLMIKGLEKNAAESIAFYRRTKPDSIVVREELDKLRRALNPDMDDDTPEDKKVKLEGQPKKKLSFWRFIKKSRSTRRALFVCLTLITASTFQGLVVLQVYAEPLFTEAVPSISATLCSILLAVVGVVSGIVAGYLTEKAGRKPLMVYSSLASGVCCVLLGLQIHLDFAPGWLTVILMYLFCMFNTFGAGTVPYVLIAEFFLPEVKSMMSMLMIEWAWLCNSVILFIFTPLLHAVGLGPMFYLFTGVCFLSAAFSARYQPETRSVPVDVIQTLFADKK